MATYLGNNNLKRAIIETCREIQDSHASIALEGLFPRWVQDIYEMVKLCPSDMRHDLNIRLLEAIPVGSQCNKIKAFAYLIDKLASSTRSGLNKEICDKAKAAMLDGWECPKFEGVRSSFIRPICDLFEQHRSGEILRMACSSDYGLVNSRLAECINDIINIIKENS